MIVAGGVPVNAVASGADLDRAVQYGNYSSVTENLPEICNNKSWKTSQAPKTLSDTEISRPRSLQS